MQNRRSKQGLWGISSLLFAGLAGAILMVFPKPAEAVPSFARQTGQECSACHTQPPRLNQMGREFKISGYRMSMLQTLGNTNIFENMPLSGRLVGDVNYDSVDKEVRPTVADASRLYASGRLTDHIGIHVNVGGDSGANAQVTIADNFGDWILGFTGGNTGFGRADPYETISRGGSFQLRRNFMVDYDRQDLRSGSLRNRGTGGMAYAYGNNLYVGVGAYDTSGNSGELQDYAVRVAYETPFGDSHIGAFWFQADEHDYRRRGDDSSATDRGRRIGFDASIQWSIGEEWNGDIIGAYVLGRQEVRNDINAPVLLGPDYNVNHSGWFVASAFHRGKWSYGITFGRYEYEDAYSNRGTIVPGGSRVTSINPNISWMFAPNARLGFDIEFLDDQLSGFDDMTARIRYDIGF